MRDSQSDDTLDEDGEEIVPEEQRFARPGVGRSIAGALVLLFFDIAIGGSFAFSLLVCPIWFVVSLLKNAIQRPGWRVALIRVAIPPLVLGVALANHEVQLRVGKANAARVVTACEEFHAAHGTYPQRLEELVPQYFPAVPRAKYCLDGEFRYWNNEGRAFLVWYPDPPYGRSIYNFDQRRWGYLD